VKSWVPSSHHSRKKSARKVRDTRRAEEELADLRVRSKCGSKECQRHGRREDAAVAIQFRPWMS
jgi:hypothetical protein